MYVRYLADHLYNEICNYYRDRKPEIITAYYHYCKYIYLSLFHFIDPLISDPQMQKLILLVYKELQKQ